jgi:hypothetical protein
MTPEHVAEQLAQVGTSLRVPDELNACLGVDASTWTRFAAQWDDLAPDRYAAELGTRWLRRYGHFLFSPADGVVTPMARSAFVQPEDSNPLYVEEDRHFEPLTDAFAKDPLLERILRLLGRLATALDDASEWSAKVTPFRVLATTDDASQPTPEGMHRDGVTLVTSLLIGRHNATGGEAPSPTWRAVSCSQPSYASPGPCFSATTAGPCTVSRRSGRVTPRGPPSATSW